MMERIYVLGDTNKKIEELSNKLHTTKANIVAIAVNAYYRKVEVRRKRNDRV